MAANPTPENDDILKALAEDLADGCHTHEVSIGIKQNTEAVLRTAISGLDAARLARGNAETTQGNAYDTLQTADAAGTTILKNCRLRLVKLFGGQFNSQWQTAGWPSGTTAVPDTQDVRFSLLGSLKVYFTANPASESTDMEATAAICTPAHKAVSDARAALNAAKLTLKDAKGAEEAAARTLRKRVRGLIDELGTLLADDDPRYTAFGLNVPANPSAPEAIMSLTATAIGGGKIHALWSYATRMTGTRMLTKRTSGAVVDPDFLTAGTVDGLEKTLTGFTPGVNVEIKVIPYNDGGDGPASPVATVLVT